MKARSSISGKGPRNFSNPALLITAWAPAFHGPPPPFLPSVRMQGCQEAATAAFGLADPQFAHDCSWVSKNVPGILGICGGGVSDSRFDVALPKTRIAVEGFHWPGRTMQRLYGICQFGPNLKPLTEAGYALSRARLAV